MSNVIGQQTPVEQPWTYEQDFVNGVIVRRSWRGEAKRVLGFIQAVKNSNPQRIRYTSDGTEAVIEAEYNLPQFGQKEIPVVIIDLHTYEVQTPSEFHAAFAGITDARIAEIKGIANRIMSGQSATLPTDGTELNLYDLLVRGQPAYIQLSYTLTRTVTASRFYPFTLSYTNDGKIFSAVQLSSELNSLDAIVPTLPALTLNASEIASGAYVAGWRKSAVHYQTASNGNRQLHETWQLAKWSSVLYDLAT